MSKIAFQLSLPETRSTSVIFASPHSGRDYPWSFLRRSMLDEQAIRSSEDAFVDELFDTAPDCGAPLIALNAPRAYIDVNRAQDELDPALIEGIVRHAHNPRIASGLGVVPRVVANGRSIYRGKITLREANARIDQVWKPYHAALTDLVLESRVMFGEAILIDCHSMPHEAIESLGSGRGKRPDIVLGDRFGAAADAHVVDRIEEAFRRQGLTVVRNAPFAGAYVTQHYGRPSKGQHVCQVEIDRALYLDEKNVRKAADFEDFRRMMDEVVADLSDIGRRKLPLAAE